MADINVTGGNSGGFNPPTFPRSGTISEGSSISFQAAGNTDVTFYAYQAGTQTDAFTTPSPYTAPASGASSQSYTLKDNYTGAVTLSLAAPGTSGGGSNGTINVGQ